VVVWTFVVWYFKREIATNDIFFLLITKYWISFLLLNDPKLRKHMRKNWILFELDFFNIILSLQIQKYHNRHCFTITIRFFGERKVFKNTLVKKFEKKKHELSNMYPIWIRLIAFSDQFFHIWFWGVTLMFYY